MFMQVLAGTQSLCVLTNSTQVAG